jgi:acyl-CoA reductase-like NAD-dependent aldehyde dehydrogenase
VKRCEKIANEIVVGDPYSEASQIGAIVNREQFEKILGYIEAGKK